jgi:diaminopimelate decarboxylase/aspartate kinase
MSREHPKTNTPSAAPPPARGGATAAGAGAITDDLAFQWVVLKFGGTSVSTLKRWQTIAEILRDGLSPRTRLLVVCSALSQVSNRLARLLAAASLGEPFREQLAELRQAHAELAGEMGLDLDQQLGDLFRELEQILEGLRLTQEVTPRLTARVMSCGELMSTRLGAAWLNRQGISTRWQDAREVLVARDALADGVSRERRYLSATCDHDYDPELEAQLSRTEDPVVLTQGFIARLPNGETALLGRGGSDTAAAYFAAKLGAERLEIWSDVPGLFTANPHRVPEARLLRRLSYGEAEEMAAKGAKVLHPRCIRPAAAHGIPIHLRCTPSHHMPGTVISAPATPRPPTVNAVAERQGIVLVSMRLEGDWQPVGLIADIAQCFKHHNLSIDLLASSQTNLTIALDPAANHLDDELLGRLLTQLEELCEPKLIQPAAAVSLVGTGIRAILHEWAPVFECFENEQIYLVAQAANNLSFTLVVHESSAGPLVHALHDRLFSGNDLPRKTFGPTWPALVERGREVEVVG